MKNLTKRLYIAVMLVPILVWTTLYELAVGVPRLLLRSWKAEIKAVRNSW